MRSETKKKLGGGGRIQEGNQDSPRVPSDITVFIKEVK